MDRAVGEEALEGGPGTLAAHGVEGAEHHCLGCVVDDDVDARGSLEGANVAALAADDPALELVRRQLHHSDRRVARLLRSLALHRGDQDLPALFSSFFADPGLSRANALGDLAGQLTLHSAQQLRACLVLRQGGHTLQLSLDRTALIFDRLSQGFELGLSATQALLVRIQLAQTALDSFLTLVGALLEPGDLSPALADLGLAFVPASRRLLFRGQKDRLAVLLGDDPQVFLAQIVSVAGFACPRNAASRVQER